MGAAMQRRLPSCLARAASALVLVVVAGACADPQACDRDQYIEYGACYPCPEDSVPGHRTCICDDPEASFEGGQCVLPTPDAGPTADEDAGPGAVQACEDYCGFLKVCLADNDTAQMLAADALAATGVEGDDVSVCRSECEATAAADRGVLECIVMGGNGSTCPGREDYAGTEEALTIVDDCCIDHTDTGVCTRMCDALRVNALTAGVLAACN